jgi:hypothetical protein
MAEIRPCDDKKVGYRATSCRLNLLSVSLTIPLICCHIKSFRRASRCGEAMARRRKEERRAGITSRGMVKRLDCGSCWIPGSWMCRCRTTQLLSPFPPGSLSFSIRRCASRTMVEHKTPESSKSVHFLLKRGIIPPACSPGEVNHGTQRCLQNSAGLERVAMVTERWASPTPRRSSSFLLCYNKLGQCAQLATSSDSIRL